jgi:hypothetical protein
MAAAKPPDAVHKVPTKPIDKKVLRFGVTASERTLRTMPIPSVGTNRPSWFGLSFSSSHPGYWHLSEVLTVLSLRSQSTSQNTLRINRRFHHLRRLHTTHDWEGITRRRPHLSMCTGGSSSYKPLYRFSVRRAAASIFKSSMRDHLLTALQLYAIAAAGVSLRHEI